MPKSHYYEAQQNSTRVLSTGVTDSAGQFQLMTPQSSTTSLFYVVAVVNDTVQLASIVGQTLPAYVTINELTTVSSAYSMAQFIHHDAIYGQTRGLTTAANMSINLVASSSGGPSEIIQTAPNADETNTFRSINTLGNLLAACVQDSEAYCTTLLHLATPDGGTTPENTLDAIIDIAKNPANNVSALYALANTQQIYSPFLNAQPDAWTLAVKVNATGNESCAFGGPGNLVFDAQGNAWISNNVVQGTPNSIDCMIVLTANGTPADGTNNTPSSPIFGGGILGAGFGVTIDTYGFIWLGNVGWGNSIPNGSVSKFNPQGIALSGADGYNANATIYRVQGIVSDQENNIWIASHGNDKLVVFLSGNPQASVVYENDTTNDAPFDIKIDRNNAAWVSNDNTNTISRFTLTGTLLTQEFRTPVGKSPLGLALDAYNNAWLATQDGVQLLNSNGVLLNTFTGGGVFSPWSTSVDGDNNIWVANFEPNAAGIYGLSKLCGYDVNSCPPHTTTGGAISPDTGYTLPSAGAQVTLHNGEPLYGAGAPPSYFPLMRMTAAVIDPAGNVWVTNNWKPDALVDVAANPGGDGIVIFVGLATPVNSPIIN